MGRHLNEQVLTFRCIQQVCFLPTTISTHNPKQINARNRVPRTVMPLLRNLLHRYTAKPTKASSGCDCVVVLQHVVHRAGANCILLGM
jgi:hypothetical protein